MTRVRVPITIGLSWLVALAAIGGQAEDADPRPRASGGTGLFDALESAPAVVLGTVGGVERIDLHGHAATLTVEQSLRGTLEITSEVRMAWEELASSRRPRFANGDRVLIALTQLPGASLWRKRFPEPGARSRVFAVAAGGDAFVRRPTFAAVDITDHYLRLGRADRNGPSGVAYLAQLLAGAQLELSRAAARRLDGVPALDDQLDPSSAAAIVRGLLRPDATPALRTSILELIGRHRLESVEPEIERLTAGQGMALPILFEARARIRGELPEAETARLAKGSVEYRRVVARYASGADAPARLANWMYSDPDAEVRRAAVTRLVALRGEGASEAALRLLSDVDSSVRFAAARALGTLGGAVVDELRAIATSGGFDAAIAAVAGLEATGLDGQPALIEIARSHPEQGIRALARVALGGSLDDSHRH